MKITSIIIICLMALLSARAKVPAINWHDLPDLPQGCYGQLVSQYRGRIVVAGGTAWKDGKKYWLADSYALDMQSAVWRKFRKLYSGYAYGAGTIHNDMLILCGGNIAGEKANLAMYSLPLAKPGAEWRKFGTLKQPMIYPAYAVCGDKLYAFGGLSDSSNWQSARAQLRSFDLNTLDQGWTELPSLPGKGRALAAMCAKDAKLYVFGGAAADRENKVVNQRKSWCFDIKTASWNRLPDMPSAARGSLAFPWKQWIIVFAGAGSSPGGKTVITDEIWFYNILERTWQKGGRAPYCAIANAVLLDDKIYLIGGEDKARSRTALCRVGVIGERK